MRTRFHNLNLRFIGEEGEGGGGGESTVEPTEPQQQESGGNPAWNSVRSELDEFSFHKIEPHLKDWDRSAQERIESVNKQYAPFKQFADQGTTPEMLATGLQLAQMADQNPEQLYQALESFLEREGRLPTKAEAKQEIKENAEGVEGIEGQEAQQVTDPRYDELAAQNQQMMQFLQAQEYQKAVDQADRELQTEQSGLQTKHPELSNADMQDIIRQAAFVAQTTGKVPSLESIHDGWFTELRTRFLSTPRPGDAAPRLVPTSGGIPSAIPQKSLGALSSAEVQDLIASSIEQNR